MKGGFGSHYNSLASAKTGFTLVELLLIITIIIILSTLGVMAYKNVGKNARDAAKKADVQAIAKAYEVGYSSSNSGRYSVLAQKNFSNGIPALVKSNSFNCIYGPDNGCTNITPNKFAICINLNEDGTKCSAPSDTCICQSSTQGEGFSGAGFAAGGPVSEESSCDPYGSLTSGLVGYWKMDELSATSPVADSTANNYAGVAAGTTILAGKFGNARNFTTSSDTVTFSPTYTGLDNLPNFTYSLWVNPEGLPVVGMSGWGLIGKNKTFLVASTSPDGSTVGQLVAGVPFMPSPNGPVLFTTTTLTSNTWQHVAMVFSSVTAGGNITGNIKIYINGIETGYSINTPGSGTGLMGDAGYPLAVGNSGALDVPFKGLVDDVRVYNRALQPVDISLLYNSGNGCLP